MVEFVCISKRSGCGSTPCSVMMPDKISKWKTSSCLASREGSAKWEIIEHCDNCEDGIELHVGEPCPVCHRVGK